MNTTSDIRDTSHPTNPDTATSRPAPARLRTRARRLTLAAITATSVVLGATAGLLPASEARAQIVTPYFALDSRVTCNQFNNTASVSVTAAPQPGYRGMTVIFQTYIQLGSTGRWSGWSNSVQLWNNFQQLASSSMSLPDLTYVRMYVQMSYWTGSGWSSPQGTWATPYMISAVDRRTPYYNGMCVT